MSHWYSLLVLVSIAYLVAFAGPPLLRSWWLRQIHWNEDHTACWSTMSARRIRNMLKEQEEARERLASCDPQQTESPRTVCR